MTQTIDYDTNNRFYYQLIPHKIFTINKLSKPIKSEVIFILDMGEIGQITTVNCQGGVKVNDVSRSDKDFAIGIHAQSSSQMSLAAKWLLSNINDKM